MLFRRFTMTSHMHNGTNNCIYGIFDELHQVRDLSERLLALDMQDAQVRVLMGEDGSRELDHDGRHHGLMARLRRILQAITEERGHVHEYAWALSQGKVVVSVQLPPRVDKAPVCQAFKASGAHFIHHYGAWVVQRLSA
jgi:hypothetical protein